MALHCTSTGRSRAVLSAYNGPAELYFTDNSDVLYWLNSNHPVLVVYNWPRVLPVLRPHLHAINGIPTLAEY